MSFAEIECLQFSMETVQRQFSVVDRGRKPVPDDWSVDSKLLRPNVLVFVRGTKMSPRAAERRWRRPGLSVTGVNISKRYSSAVPCQWRSSRSVVVMWSNFPYSRGPGFNQYDSNAFSFCEMHAVVWCLQQKSGRGRHSTAAPTTTIATIFHARTMTK